MKTIQYKGGTIDPNGHGGYQWEHEDFFDVDFDGESYHAFGAGVADTIEEAKEAIDDLLENYIRVCAECEEEVQESTYTIGDGWDSQTYCPGCRNVEGETKWIKI